jgi:putative transposase
VTDKLRSYGVAHRELIPEVIHSTEQYENNRADHFRDIRMSAFGEWGRAVA